MAIQKRIVKFGGFAMVGIVAVVGGALTIQPLVTEQQSQAKAIQTLQSQKTSLQTTKNSYLTAEAQYNAIKTISDSLSKDFPESSQVEGLVGMLTASAQNAGIAKDNIKNVSFTAPTVNSDSGSSSSSSAQSQVTSTTNGSATIPVEVTVDGSLSQLSAFLTNMRKASRIIVINNFSIARQTAKLYELQFSGSTYLYTAVKAPTTSNNVNVQNNANNDTPASSSPAPSAGATNSAPASSAPASSAPASSSANASQPAN